MQGRYQEIPRVKRAILTLAVFVAVARVCAEEPPEDKATESDRAQDRARLETMREIVTAVKLVTITGEEQTVSDLVPEPLLRFSDAPFGMPDATVWAWGRKGRPTALLKLELYPDFSARSIWSFAFTSLSTGAVAAEYDDQRCWSPTQPGFEPRPLPDVPPAAEKPAQRLRQMKDLARRFTAYRVWDPKDRRTQLRLLSRPLHRYDDAETGLLDGTVFGLAKDTNPNIVLLIEAVAAGDAHGSWRYALVRHGDAEYHVEFDGHEVWEAPERPGVDPLGPFHWFHRPALSGAAGGEKR